jgi:hypothetical protein
MSDEEFLEARPGNLVHFLLCYVENGSRSAGFRDQDGADKVIWSNDCTTFCHTADAMFSLVADFGGKVT